MKKSDVKKKPKKLRLSKETLAHLPGGGIDTETETLEGASRSYCMPECISGFGICQQ